jgi:hypothetical protein
METRITQLSIRPIPTKNFVFNFSLNKKKKMKEVNTQYVENRLVMSPWLMPAFYANMNASIVVLWKVMLTETRRRRPRTLVQLTTTLLS